MIKQLKLMKMNSMKYVFLICGSLIEKLTSQKLAYYNVVTKKTLFFLKTSKVKTIRSLIQQNIFALCSIHKSLRCKMY